MFYQRRHRLGICRGWSGQLSLKLEAATTVQRAVIIPRHRAGFEVWAQVLEDVKVPVDKLHPRADQHRRVRLDQGRQLGRRPPRARRAVHKRLYV